MTIRLMLTKRTFFVTVIFALALTGCSQQPTLNPSTLKHDNPYLKAVPPIPPTAQSAFDNAVVSIKKGKLNAAKETLLLLKANHPNLSGVYLNLALIAKRQGKLDEAKRLFLETTRVNALNYEAFNQLALLHREAGKFKQAETAYQQGLAIWGGNPDIHYNLAILYDLYLNQIDSALEHYKLYQTLIEEPDKQVTVWISALERRQNDQ